MNFGEACDDGNTASGDGCSATCTSDETCGNNVRDPDESCDDGNAIAGDGCSRCTVDPYCGDGELDPGEGCDDGNNTNFDGCNIKCAVEATCGDGVVNTAEECDDGNLASGDGCSVSCLDECYPGSVTYDATATTIGAGTIQTFVVPSCVEAVTITAYGAQGGSPSNGPGGLGAQVTGTFAVTGGQTLNISGGGSFNAGTSPSAIAGARSGAGQVTISWQ